MARLPDEWWNGSSGNLSPTSGGGARHPAAAQRQGTDRAVPVSQGHQSEFEHRPGEKCLAVQRRVRQERSVIDWVMLAEASACAMRWSCCAGTIFLPLPTPRNRRAKIHDGETAAAHRTYGHDKRLLEAVVEHYHETLKMSPEAQQYLVKRGLQSSEMVEQFRLGFANRTLGYRMPEKNRSAAQSSADGCSNSVCCARTDANTCVVPRDPIFNREGEVVQMYGRKIAPRHLLREDTAEHLYCPARTGACGTRRR